jgi:hypothetical protein
MAVKLLLDSTETQTWSDAEFDIDTVSEDFAFIFDVSGTGGSNPIVVLLGRLNTGSNPVADGTNLGDTINTSEWIFKTTATGSKGTPPAFCNWDIGCPNKVAAYMQNNTGNRRVRVWIIYNERTDK